MIADMTNKYPLRIPTIIATSAYIKRDNSPTLILKDIIKEPSILVPKLISILISKDTNNPCYKASISNINIFLRKNNTYNNSKKKILIEENIDDFICEYGQSESESISNIKEKNKIQCSDVCRYEK